MEGDGALGGEVATLVRRILEQCEFLDKKLRDPNLARPDVIESMVMEFILKAVDVFAREVHRPAGDVAGTGGGRLDDVLAAFQAMHARLARRRLDVHLHLQDLAEGWTCPGCGHAVPRDAEVRGVRRPPLVILLRCKACNVTSEVSVGGYAAFQDLFGELYNDGEGPWNPLANRFIWKGD